MPDDEQHELGRLAEAIEGQKNTCTETRTCIFEKLDRIELLLRGNGQVPGMVTRMYGLEQAAKRRSKLSWIVFACVIGLVGKAVYAWVVNGVP